MSTRVLLAGQIGVVRKNLVAAMEGRRPEAVYDGYTSCPLITGYHKCVMAEFDYNGQPLETFPVNQGKERRTMFHMKKDMMPMIYWLGLVR
jgi:eukaryotic sulfide quinone oxidoreductase